MKKININIRKNWLVYLIGVLFLIFIIRFRLEIIDILFTVKTGLYRWMLLAFLLQFATYYFFALTYQASLYVVDIHRKIKELIPLVLSVMVINITTPTAGLGSTLLFSRDAQKRKESPIKAAAAVLLIMGVESIGFSSFLIFSILYLSLNGTLGTTELISTLMFIALNILLLFLFTIALTESSLLLQILTWVEGLINRFRRHKVHGWAKNLNTELREMAKSIIKKPKQVARAILFQVLANTASIASLYLLFAAFSQYPKFGIVVSGYAITYLFKIISPSPEGIGIAEGAMVIIYTSFGIPILEASAIALTFRLINFWIPLGLGFFFFNKHNYSVK